MQSILVNSKINGKILPLADYDKIVDKREFLLYSKEVRHNHC